MALRVLLINQAFYPDTVATAQHVTDLAVFLSGRGHDVSVLCARRAYATPNVQFLKKERYQGINIVRALGTGFGKRSFFFRVIDIVTLQVALAWRLMLFARQDVVIAFTSPPLVSFLAVLFCKVRGGGLVSWLMDVNPDAAIAAGYLARRSPITRILTAIFKRTLSASRNIVVLDRWMRERIIDYGVEPVRVIVIPPWDIQDPQAFNKSDISGAQNPFRKAHNLQQKFVVLYSGNLSVVHPLDTLLSAAVRLRDDERTTFLFVGGGLRSKDVEQARQNYKLTNILQLPYQPRARLPYSLSCADIHVIVLGAAVSGLVHTSKVYGTLMAGRPFIAVAPQKSHLSDLVSEVPGGFLVEHGDVDGFLGALEACRKLSREELVFIQNSQRTYLIQNFALESLLKRFEAVALTQFDVKASTQIANEST